MHVFVFVKKYFIGKIKNKIEFEIASGKRIHVFAPYCGKTTVASVNVGCDRLHL